MERLARSLRPRVLLRSMPLALAILCAAATFASADSLPTALSDWMHREQKLLSREVNEQRIYTPTENHQRSEFRPETAREFVVKSYWVPEGAANAFVGDGMEPALRRTMTRTRGGVRQVRLLVHPESEAFYAPFLKSSRAVRGGDFRAQATASSRTLLVWRAGEASNAFFAKLSLDARIGGVVRTIPAGEVARSIGINNVLHGSSLPKSFGYLPEVFGVMPRGMPRGGMIIRSIPPEVRRGDVKLVPLFSLYAQPPSGRPLLVEMIAKSGMKPRDFIGERILKPFAKQWAELAVKHGITTEPHAQNVLLEVDGKGMPTGRFFHRDFGGFNVDFDYREQLGWAPPSNLPVIAGRNQDYFVDKHAETNAHLETYFGQGFVHNLETNLAKWEAKGWVARTWRGLRTKSFMNDLRLYTAKAFAEVSGTKRRIHSLKDLDSVTQAARAAEIKRHTQRAPARLIGRTRQAPRALPARRTMRSSRIAPRAPRAPRAARAAR